MTETDWLACTSLEEMWRLLEGRHTLSLRKWRLFAIAATRLVAEWFIDPTQEAALHLAERYADGSVTAEELAQATEQAGEIADKLFWTCESRDSSAGLCPEEFEDLQIPRTPSTERLSALCGLWAAKGAAVAVGVVTRTDWAEWVRPRWSSDRPRPVGETLGEVITASASAQLLAAFGDVDPDDSPVYGAEYESACAAMDGRFVPLLRDIAGNPFRAVVINPAWLTPTVRALATELYDTGDFSAMPVLADALEDAGCADEQLLAHCRGPGPHARGCFVLDHLLAKE